MTVFVEIESRGPTRPIRVGLWGLATLGCLLMAGCSGSASKFERASIRGTITLDDKPLSSGQILFLPVKGVVGRPSFAVIKEGHYEISTEKGPAIGTNRVEITAIRKTGKFEDVDGQQAEISEQYLPERYNAATELQLDITSGPNDKNFDLKSK